MIPNPLSGWWFQPLWKILVKWDDSSQYMENKKCSKPPISYIYLLFTIDSVVDIRKILEITTSRLIQLSLHGIIQLPAGHLWDLGSQLLANAPECSPHGKPGNCFTRCSEIAGVFGKWSGTEFTDLLRWNHMTSEASGNSPVDLPSVPTENQWEFQDPKMEVR